MISESNSPKRRRRSNEEWRELLSNPEVRSLTRVQLAERFSCSLGTIHAQLAKLKAPEKVSIGRLLEVDHKPVVHELSDAVLVLQTPSGLILRFNMLPPPEYLASALRLVG